MRRVTTLCLIPVLLIAFFLPVYAEENEAENITGSTSISGSNLDDYGILTDGLEAETLYVGDSLTLTNESGIGSLYIVLEFPCAYVVRDLDTGKSFSEADKGFLHVFADMEARLGYVPSRIEVQFPGGAWIGEIQVFSTGVVPAYVQNWQQPLTGGTDIVLFSTHGDDEQLYFAGLLPYYAAERGLNVQVVYMTSHSNLDGSLRQHEMLNGLWAVGVRTYPVFGAFPDFKIMDREETYLEYENLGFPRAELLEFVVENIRRFQPLVAVGHDLNGEYGHGMHMVYADLLTQAVTLSTDPRQFPESASRYGVWDVPKTYLHLYPENEIVMDWDQPLEAFDGLTAFEVTQQYGFPCHISQQYPLYTNWLYGKGTITKASQIGTWNPCYYGLYRSTVGEDVEKNDFMENLTSYGEISRESEAREQELRNALTLARQQHTQEPKLLRPAEEEAQGPAADPRKFPALAMAISVLTLAIILVFFVSNKFFEKK